MERNNNHGLALGILPPKPNRIRTRPQLSKNLDRHTENMGKRLGPSVCSSSELRSAELSGHVPSERSCNSKHEHIIHISCPRKQLPMEHAIPKHDLWQGFEPRMGRTHSNRMDLRASILRQRLCNKLRSMVRLETVNSPVHDVRRPEIFVGAAALHHDWRR